MKRAALSRGRVQQAYLDSFSLKEHMGEIHMSPKVESGKRRHEQTSACWCNPVQGIAKSFWVHQYQEITPAVAETAN